ncbi:Serine/threonine-protein kinase Nek4 [Bulinus truncatus]|nr:Serine/threonine-protein kinase Nek4 [Bulinus truncatus]
MAFELVYFFYCKQFTLNLFIRMFDQHLSIKCSIHQKLVWGGLGQGAFGEVYHLKVACGNEFALKVVSTYKTDEKKVDSEAKLMTKLCHPHLVQCCAYSVDSQHLYLVIELCHHGNLRDYLKGCKGSHYVPENKVLLWLGQMADVLRYLHDSRIIHRDLKPDNLFLDGRQNIKVGDLGIARELDFTYQKLETFIGTYLYMSPELLKGESYTTKTDIWSLGCCIHEVMTLSPTFVCESIAELVKNVTKGKIGPMPNIYQSILQELIHRIFTVKPKLRPDATDVLFYVCQIQGRPYMAGPHKPMDRLPLDTKVLCQSLKDFKDRSSRPLLKLKKQNPGSYKQKSDSSFNPDSLQSVSSDSSSTSDTEDLKKKKPSFEEERSAGSNFMKDLAEESLQLLKSKNGSAPHQKLNKPSFNDSSDFDSLVTLYTRAQKVTFVKNNARASHTSDNLTTDVKPEVIEAAKDVIRLFEHHDPNTMDVDGRVPYKVIRPCPCPEWLMPPVTLEACSSP